MSATINNSTGQQSLGAIIGLLSAVCMYIACFPAGLPAAWAQPFCVKPQPSFALGSNQSGVSSSQEIAFDHQAGELQMSRANLIYPADFVFNGFTGGGREANTQVGTMFVSVGRSGKKDFSFPIRAISKNLVYVDIDDDGVRQFLDSTISHSVQGDGSHRFKIIAYFGGDQDPTISTELIGARTRVLLNPGIVTNPATPGSYPLSGEFISVNPDTGDQPLSEDESFERCSFSIDALIQTEPGGCSADQELSSLLCRLKQLLVLSSQLGLARKPLRRLLRHLKTASKKLSRANDLAESRQSSSKLKRFLKQTLRGLARSRRQVKKLQQSSSAATRSAVLENMDSLLSDLRAAQKSS